jgi:hypothetical protein
LEGAKGPVELNIFGGAECPLGVKTGNAQFERLFSALPLRAGLAGNGGDGEIELAAILPTICNAWARLHSTSVDGPYATNAYA